MFKFLSISSLADAYIIGKGCYNGVVELSGMCWEFIQKTVVGGRVMTACNKRYLIELLELLDADANSLYSTSMSISKYPTGAPIKFENGNVPDNCVYFARVEFLWNPSYPLDFPLISYLDSKGNRKFSNEL